MKDLSEEMASLYSILNGLEMCLCSGVIGDLRNASERRVSQDFEFLVLN